jgi:hypothetical protein
MEPTRGIENVTVIQAHDPFAGQDALEAMPEALIEVHPLDSPEAIQRLNKIEDWWVQARQAQADARYEMALDQDFYDGLQWSDEDKLELMDRGQMPLVFNRVKPSVDWILGSEKRTRVDFKVYPRGDEDTPLAEVKTKLLKYLGDVNKSGFARSMAFAHAVTVGVGWLEDGIRTDQSDEPLYSRCEDWRNIWYDHLSAEKDMSDARYIFRSKWIDLDIAETMFPDRAERIRAAAVNYNLTTTDDDEFYWMGNRVSKDGRMVSRATSIDNAFNVDNRRDRVRLVECWYREPAPVRIIRGAPRFEGFMFNRDDPDQVGLIEDGTATLYDAVRMVVRCAIFIDGLDSIGCLLQDMPSPYHHNRIPFTPVWCYRRGRDRTAYGVIRNLRDVQEDLNKRRSKALYILSTNKLIADANAFDDWDEVAEEMARPDGILKKRPGSDVQLFNETKLAEEHVMMEQADAQHIQDVSGVTDENLGRETNAQSGKAIQARQDQGTLVTADIFDNLRLAIQLQGEIQLSLIEQFYDQPKIIRLLGDRGSFEFMRINQAEQAAMAKGVMPASLDDGVNDITASQADFIVDAQDFRETVRLAMFDSLLNLCGQLPPEISFQILDLVMDLSDMPGKDEIVARIRKLNGQVDPARADSPEGQEDLMAQEQQKQEQSAIEQQAIMNQLAEQEAKIRKLLADAQLVLEKTKTEQVNREVNMARVIMDQQKMETDTALQARAHDITAAKNVSDAENKNRQNPKTTKQ